MSRPLAQQRSSFSADVRATDFTLLPNQRLLVAAADATLHRVEPGLPRIGKLASGEGSHLTATASSGSLALVVLNGCEIHRLSPIELGRTAPLATERIWSSDPPETISKLAVSSNGALWAANLTTKLPGARNHR